MESLRGKARRWLSALLPRDPSRSTQRQLCYCGVDRKAENDPGLQGYLGLQELRRM